MPLAKPSLYRAAGVAALLAFLPATAACTQPSPSSGPAESSHGMTDNALPGNHVHALALYFAFYNFCRIHKTLRMSPAMAAGITDRLWSLEDIVAKIDEMAPPPKPRGPYKKRGS